MGRGVGVGVGVGILVGVEVGVGVGVDMIPLQPNKVNPIKMKKPIRNQSLFLSNMIPPDLETRLSRPQFAPLDCQIQQFDSGFGNPLRTSLPRLVFL